MENALFANVKKLFDHQLYECVIPAASLLSSVLHNDRNVATLEMEYQVQLYLANAHYKQGDFRIAKHQLDCLLMQRRTMIRYKSACLTAIESSYAQFTEVELRRRLAECYKEIGESAKAIATLLAVPAKSRTPRMNLMLARLQHYSTASGGRDKAEAQVAYKELLRECPMALQGIKALLEMGVDGNEVNSLIMNASPVPQNIEWLSSWIKAQAQMFDCKHLEAARTLQHLNDSTPLYRNEHLLQEIGRVLYYHGNHAQAEQYLSSAVSSNPHNMEAVGLLSVVYELGDTAEVERDRLYAQVAAEREFTAGHWFVHAQHMYGSGKFQRGLSFADRCLSLEPRHPEALLLRGRLLALLERHTESIEAFRVAQLTIPYRFEVYKGLYHCYVTQRRFKEAQAICSWTIHNFRTSPRSYTMFGRTLFHSSNAAVKKKARSFAEKALKIDPNYTPGVALLAEICQYEGCNRAAINLLEQHVSVVPHANLFVLLADILRMEKEPVRALEFYYLALGLDAKCPRALRGISALKSTGTAPEVAITDAEPSTSQSAAENYQSAAGMATPCGTPNPEWMSEDLSETSPNVEEPLSSPAAGEDVLDIQDMQDIQDVLDIHNIENPTPDPLDTQSVQDMQDQEQDVREMQDMQDMQATQDALEALEADGAESDAMSESLWHDVDADMMN